MFEELGLLTNDSNEVTNIVKISNDAEEMPFIIPSITFDDFCSGTQELEIGRNFTFSCQMAVTNCTADNFISVHQIVKQSYFLQSTVESFQTRKPVWKNGTCHDVLKEIRITFIVNDTEIIDCILSDIYLIDVKERENFKQTYFIEFIENVFNKTDARGYEYGNSIATDKNDTVLRVPSVGYCSAEGATPIKFLQQLSTGCYIRARSCEEVQSLTKDIYESFSPAFISSEPSEKGGRRVPFLKANLSFPAIVDDKSCSIVSSYKLKIAYAKQGFEHDFYLLIVAFTSTYKLSKIAFATNQTVPIPFQISFHDVTQRPQTTFAALPHINLRLPNDFFFPFVSSITSSSQSLLSIFVAFYLLELA